MDGGKIAPLPASLPRVANEDLDGWIKAQEKKRVKLEGDWPKLWDAALKARLKSTNRQSVYCDHCGAFLTKNTKGLVLHGGSVLLCGSCKRSYRTHFGETQGVGL